MKKISRRTFLTQTTTAAITAVSAPYFIPSAALGKAGTAAPSQRLTMGVIGIGGQGMLNLRNFLTCEDVRILAVCDVDRNHLLAAKSVVDETYQNQDCTAYNDFRELLARADIDTVMIATPDHWHALISIAAARAGKDIYCEKPISLTIAEGRAVADTMKRYGTVYQSGTQRRSIESFEFTIRVARSGMLGKLHTIHTYLGEGPAAGVMPPEPIPDGFDYDMWLGPAPYEPYTPRRCHGTFRFIYDYSGGQLTDLGAHFNDLAQWGNNTDHTGPVEFEGRGEFPRDGLYNTPTRYSVTATYADGVKLVFHDERPFAVRFEGEEGWVYTDDNGNVDAEPKSILKTRKAIQYAYVEGIRRGYYEYMTGHHRNFLNCVKSRSQTTSAPEIAHRSTTVCHIGNLCLRLGRRLKWDPQTEQFTNDPQANRMISRAMRAPWHL